MKNTLFLLLFLVSGIATAQIQDTLVQFNGQEFCIHKIQQGETLFQLSRTYKMPYSLLKAGNPEVGDAIALGTLIRIPCKYIGKSTGEKELDKSELGKKEVGKTELKNQPTKKEEPKQGIRARIDEIVRQAKRDSIKRAQENLPKGYQWHLVQAGETMYSLSKRYDITELDILLANPLVAKEGLKAGESIKIKQLAAEVQQSSTAIELSESPELIESVDSLLKIQSVFRIGLLLPFEFDENAQHIANLKEEDELTILNKTNFFIDFYQGFSLALDSLTKLGHSFQTFVYDSKSDTNAISKILKRKEIDSLDLIVGPGFSKNFVYTARQLREKPIHLLSPYGSGKEIIEGNPKVIKIRGSRESRVKALANHLYKYNHEDNLVFVHQTEKEKVLLEKLQQELLSLSLLKDSVMMKTPKIVKGIYEPLSQLNREFSNIVVSLSTDESFSTKLVAKMQSRHKDYEITLIGMEEWKNYKNIEITHWEALGIHLVGNLDYRYVGVKDSAFFKNYFKEFHTEPSYHALLAYESLLNTLCHLQGNNYQHSQIVGEHRAGDLGAYRFKYTAGNWGLENKAAAVYKYENFSFKKLP